MLLERRDEESRLSSEESARARARVLLEANRYATLATATTNGSPWVTPIFFAFDEAGRLYWVSNKNARHSYLIGLNTRVAISIFDPARPEEGLYLEADAIELGPGALEHPIAVFNARADVDKFKIESEQDLTGEAAWRMYRATPMRAFLLGSGKEIQDQHVDTRDEIPLTALKA
jgi:hypothetical protein